jgi:phosphonopyruvate decarboxylase
MIKPASLYKCFLENGIDFFTGVPDSLLKDFCSYVTDKSPSSKNIIAANEGGAIALATGYYLATGKMTLVYMQNSGIGNAVNPLMSLADKEVYSIPMLLMIGWRGEPGVKDEPQHIKQGRITLSMLESMEIPYNILDESTDFEKVVSNLIELSKTNLTPAALVIKKNSFEQYKLVNNDLINYELTREQALEIVINNISQDSIIVSTTGMLSRELYELRDKYNVSHKTDFLTVGSMGHASQIALGIALSKPEKEVFIFDGDGAFLMHTGSIGIIGNLSPKNLKHIVFNNGSHDSVGGQPTIGLKIDIPKICSSFNYKYSCKVESKLELHEQLDKISTIEGPALLEIIVKKGSRKDLGRPKTTTIENKNSFMDCLKNEAN